MSTRKKSINQRLRDLPVGSPIRIDVAQAWAEKWRGEQNSLLCRLQAGLVAGDMRAISDHVTELKALSTRKFAGLSGVIGSVSEKVGIELIQGDNCECAGTRDSAELTATRKSHVH